MIAEATQLVHCVLSIDMGGGCLNADWHYKKTEQETSHTVMYTHRLLCFWWHVIQFVADPLIPRTIGGHLLFPPKHLFQTAPTIKFLDMNVGFHQQQHLVQEGWSSACRILVSICNPVVMQLIVQHHLVTIDQVVFMDQ